MRIATRLTTAMAVVAATGWLTLNLPKSAHAQPPVGAEAKGGGIAQDPRVQTRTYHFYTNEDLPYSLYVSSKVKKDQKAPMAVTTKS